MGHFKPSLGLYILLMNDDVSISHTASEKVPLLPQGPPPSTGDAPKLIGAASSTHDAEREAKPSSAGATSRATRPESLTLNQPLVPLKLVRVKCCVYQLVC